MSDLAANPQAWDGRRVEVEGLIVIDFEEVGLYQSWDDYCDSKWGTKAISVDWKEDRRFREANNHRMAVVRGIFHNELAPWAPASAIITSEVGPGL